jgi:hydroxyacylglutathione hydrolase
MDLIVHSLVNGELEENCYLLQAPGRADCVVVDPGSSGAALVQACRDKGLSPALLLATHGHYDHVGAVHALQQAFGAPFAMHTEDAGLLDALEDTFAFYGWGPTQKPAVQRWLKGGEVLEAAGLSLDVLATPGHTPGGLCFYHAPSGTLFSGDTLFAGSVGRSDMEGGDGRALIAGIKAKLLTLPAETRVYPGHGPASTVGREAAGNRFLR